MSRVIRSLRWTLAVLALAAGLAGPAEIRAAEAVVTDVRVGDHAGTTRVVFELSKPVPFSIFTLGDPNRVVIDLPEVGWRLPARPLPGAAGVFRKLRYGLFEPGTSRVVIEVRNPAAVRSAFVLEPDGAHPTRLVLDLAPTTLEAFLGGVGKAPRRVSGTRRAPSALAPPPAATPRSAAEAPAAAPEPTPKEKTVLAAAPAPAQATPFRLAPRKPEPKHRGRKRVIMIDPGHGGVDPGTIGISGVYEKHVTLSMARELKKEFEKTGRFKVLLTRDRDVFIRLRDRVRIAREAEADLFISVHADTVKNRRIKGPAVYTLSEKASDREAAELAEKENKADLIAGIDLTHETPEVTNILIDLAQRESMNQSARFAALLIRELKQKTRVLRNTHRFAGFAVLKAPDVPSVLLELGFLSNPADERALRSHRYRVRLASAVVRAAETYFARVEEATRK